jgi:NAD(P)-dependent dehydrogenase (short-subunit alcohol dehydrogenase family)
MKALEGRNAVITGASQGLGLAIATAFVAAGASVFVCARNAAQLERARASLASIALPGQQVLAAVADVAQPAQVEGLIAAAVASFGQIHVLVNNAGVYGPLGRFEDVACRLTETLALELEADHVDVNAVAPGALATRMTDQLIEAGPDAVGLDFFERMRQIRNDGGTPLERGADLSVYLASAASDGITGRLVSAVWDPWSRLQEHRSELRDSDIYTLRRIVPGDRGKSWEIA